MQHDLASAFVLALFGAFAAGGLLGFVVGKLLGFETGIGLGLLVPGVVSLWFTTAFASESRTFRDAPDRTTGRVVAVEERAVGSAGGVTTPVAIIEYETAAGTTARIESRAASGLAVGDTPVVLPGATPPRVGEPDQLFGGTIAALLFGTFPLSAGIYFLVAAVADARESRRAARETEPAWRKGSWLTIAANLTMFAGLLGAPLLAESTLRIITIAFGIVSVGLWMHVADGIALRRGVRVWLGIAVVAINFSVWSASLWWLAPATSGW